MGIFPGLEVFSVPTKFVASRGVTAGKTFHAGGRNGRTGIEAVGASSWGHGLAHSPSRGAAANVARPTGSAVTATSGVAGSCCSSSGRARSERQCAGSRPASAQHRRSAGGSRAGSDAGTCQPAAARRHHSEESRAGAEGCRQEAGSEETGCVSAAGGSRRGGAAPDKHRDADLGTDARYPIHLSAR